MTVSEAEVMEPLGELVALNEAPVDTRGHVVAVSDDRRTVQIPLGAASRL